MLAAERNTEEMLFLFKEVANWIKGTGSEQWGDVARGENDDEIKQAIMEKSAFVVKREQLIVAVFILYLKPSDWDEWLWEQTNESAVYLHKLALKPSEIGTGLGSNLLKWIEIFLVNNGNEKLRLDCIADNKKLNHFYLKNDFKKLGVSKGFSLYEKELSSGK